LVDQTDERALGGLVSFKRRFDPDNFFRLDQNVSPG